jgi:Putative auto-transporter adhesin, head GIN domain
MRALGWIAICGLGIGIASLSFAYALGGRDLHRLPFDLASIASCGKGAKAGGPSVRRLAWDNGAAIELSVPGTVFFRGGQGSEIVVRGSPDLVANVEVRGSRLTLDCRGWTAGRDLEITLPGRAFRHIGLSGSGKLVMENVSQPDLALRIGGSGTVRAQGSVDQATVKISGSGEARLGDLAMKQLTVDISGSGKVEAGPTDTADVKISGSGDVKLLSRPASLASKVSGSGRITHAAPASADGRNKR